jgi:hypothetical protein
MKLNEISPEWAKSIELGHIVDPDLHIASPCCCVVGEAYAFKYVQYTCKECDTISMEYFAAIEQHYKAKREMWKEGDLSFNREKVSRITRKFEMHWSKEHQDLTLYSSLLPESIAATCRSNSQEDSI